MLGLSVMQLNGTTVNNVVTNDDKSATGEYNALFVDGKEWVVAHGWELNGWNSSLREYQTHQVLRISVVGDEVIEGIECKKLKVKCEMDKFSPDSSVGFEGLVCCTKFSSDEAFYYVYEKDRKIYVYRNPGPYCEIPAEGDDFMGMPEVKYGEPYFDLYMDLNHTVGEKISCYNPVSMLYHPVEIVMDEYENYAGMSCRTLTLSDGSHWIEGVGSDQLVSMYNPYHDGLLDIPTSFTGLFSVMVSCTQDGKFVYDNRNLLHQNGVYVDDFLSGADTISADNVMEDGAYYNMYGLKVDKPSKGCIYIHKGKKIIYK